MSKGSFNTAVSSEMGWINVVANEQYVTAVHFCDKRPEETEESCPLLSLAVEELQAYLWGKSTRFSVPLQQDGTDFQQTVWKHLLDIPFGKTCSYLDIAMQMGDAKKVRAVGSANGSNQIAIMVPCHRVIGSGGKLVGYNSGINKKRWLLDHEYHVFSGQGKLF